MLFEMKYYDTPEAFNRDALARYQSVMSDRSATSYDCFWKVDQMVKLPSSVFWVIWSRPAPLRKH